MPFINKFHYECLLLTVGTYYWQPVYFLCSVFIVHAIQTQETTSKQVYGQKLLKATLYLFLFRFFMCQLPGAIQEQHHRVFAPIVNWLCLLSRLFLHRVELLCVRMHNSAPLWDA